MTNNVHTGDIPSDWIDLNQFERLYPFSRRTAWVWISEGRIPAYRPGRRKVLLKRSDIDKMIESKRVNVDIDKIVTETLAEVLAK